MFELVTDDTALERLCERLSREDWIGLDTEFVRERTYFPRLGLVQLTDRGSRVTCVDPLAVSSLEPLTGVLWPDGTTRVMHACAQDLEVLYAIRPAPMLGVFDTQVAAALLGHDAQESYASLVSSRLGIGLEKAHTRADWTRRPLSESELRYAADDVRHLPALYDDLRDELERRGRLQWAIDESAALSAPSRFLPDPGNAWRGVKGGRTADATAQAALVSLAAWRERTAVRQDRPRRWVLADAVLVAVANARPATLNALRAIPDIPPAVVRKHGAALLEIVQAAEPPDGPGDVQDALDVGQKRRVNEMMQRVRRRAGELGVAPSLLATRKDCESLVRGARDGRVLQGWRREAVGEELLELSAGA